MAHQSAKHKNTHASKKPHAELEAIDAIKEVQAKVHEKAHQKVDESTDNIARAAEWYERGATEGIKKGSEKITSLFKAGNKTSVAYKEISGKIAKSCSQMFAESVELSKEMLACRTGKGMIELQNKAVLQLCDNYFETMNKLREIVFDSYAEALESVHAETAHDAAKSRQSMAA